ncbi:MAG: antibiotic biosynthesis monooxygenase [Stellaceae bacterium]
MFAVIFEVQPRPDRWEDYLALAGSLRPELEQVDGFLENERFRSRQRAGRVLSLSIWRDEKAVIRWRTLARHHYAQARGRSEIFEDYHLRVGEIVADSRLPAGRSLSRQRFDDTEIVTAKLVTISELAGQGSESADLATALGLPSAGMQGVVEHETFAGIDDPHRTLLLASWSDAAAGELWRPVAHHADIRHRAVRIIRDYGMNDRREAPQYYPPVSAAQDGG